MASLTLNCRLHWIKSYLNSCGNYSKVILYDVPKTSSPRLYSGLNLLPRASARRSRKTPKTPKKNESPGQSTVEISPPKYEDGQDETELKVSDTTVPSRSTVLRACTVTSASIAALGIALRQVSHFASTEGFPILDCSSKASFDFEIWHVELITGIVVAISSLRYLLLKTWPDFAESSKAANQQVLTSLEPLDYLVVAFFPGISEELLFRGGLLPLFGFDWKSVLIVASIFGVLHLGGGRKYSFAIWATFVGFVYGYATITSSSLIVPIASHVANNLIGGALWQLSNESSSSSDQKIKDFN